MGNDGRYQLILVAITCFTLLEVISITYSQVYLFFPGEFICPAHITDCKTYVCALPEAQQEKYFDTSVTTLATHFGNYRCKGVTDLSLAQTFSYTGGFAGIVLGLVLIKFMTQRQLLITLLLVVLFGLVLILVSPWLWLAGVGLFLCTMARGSTVQLITAYLFVWVSEEKKADYYLMT